MDLNVQLNFLRDAYSQYAEKLKVSKRSWTVDRGEDIMGTFDVLRSQCDICHRWTQVYRERTDNRINLVSLSEVM
jgi:hypothetical protein